MSQASDVLLIYIHANVILTTTTELTEQMCFLVRKLSVSL